MIGTMQGLIGEIEREFGLGEAEDVAALPPRGTRAYIRWVQSSLNQALGTALALDGMMGPRTRSTIQQFQRRYGLAADGIVGPRTESALRAAAGPGGGSVPAAAQSCEVLDRFGFDSAVVPAFHQPKITEMARRIVDSQGTSLPIRLIRLVGHTDPVGSDAYNLGLGRRRAEAIRKSLFDAIEAQRRGLGATLAFDVQSRGEREPIPGNDAGSRRVEVCLPTPPAPRGCPPFRERIRLHIKILVPPSRFTIATMVSSMQQVYGPAGFLVEVASTENLNIPALEDLDIHCPGSATATCCPFPCATNNLNAEHIALFRNRNNVGTNELAVYFVRSTDPALNGCCAHPPGSPGVVITSIASQWSLGHEIGHVLGLPHVNDSDRLMFGGGTDNITNPPPDLIAAEIQIMTNSPLTIPC